MKIKKIIKSNIFLSRIVYRIRLLRCKFLMEKYGKENIGSRKVLFFKSGGGYGDNPKAVAEFLHAKYPDLQLIWAYNSTVGLDSIPEYIKPVVYESKEFFRELSTAGAWVCSTILPHGVQKRSGQLYIQTWHGDKFLKKIAKDAMEDIPRYKWREISNHFCEADICDYYVTGCEWFVPIAASALDYSGAFLRVGMPRNDCLVNIDEKKCLEIKEKLKIASDIKVLIYAPTFRDYEKSYDSIGTDIDLETILNVLEKKYGCKWLCLMRAHTGKMLTINNEKISDARFKDVTTYPDMADLLMISDMLISDYSSCGADFSITGKMVLLYQDDIDQYTTKGRTLYFTREESPYFTASTMDEAIEIIENVSEDDIKRNSQQILDFYDSFETGHACEKVCKVIIDSLNRIQ